MITARERRGGVRTRANWGCRLSGRLAAGATALVIGMGALPAISAALGVVPTRAASRPVPPPFRVTITDAAFTPSHIAVAAGQTIEFENHAAEPRSVAADDGSFDSGPVAVGGRFVIAIPTPVTFAIHAGGPAPAPTGDVTVGQLELAGAPTDRWWGAIPSSPPPPASVDVQPR